MSRVSITNEVVKVKGHTYRHVDVCRMKTRKGYASIHKVHDMKAVVIDAVNGNFLQETVRLWLLREYSSKMTIQHSFQSDVFEQLREL